MIRFARPSDLDEIVAMGKRAHEKSSYAAYTVNDRTCRDTLRTCMATESRCVLLAIDCDNKPTGFIIGAVESYWFLTNVKVASDWMTYAERPGDGRRLLRAFVRWAKEQGACELELSISVGGVAAERTESLYRHLGLTSVGALMRKTI